MESERGPFRSPVDEPAEFSDTFGQGTHANTSSPYNNGTDIFAERGTPIVAPPVSGTVERTSSGLGGNALFLTSDEGTKYYFAHLDSYAGELVDGQRVEPGTPLGTVGDTGNAKGTSPHLHICPVKDGAAWNPYELLKRAQSGGQMT